MWADSNQQRVFIWLKVQKTHKLEDGSIRKRLMTETNKKKKLRRVYKLLMTNFDICLWSV